MAYTGRQYQKATDTAPPEETNPAVVELSDGTDVQVIRLDTGTDDTPTPLSTDAPLPVSVQDSALPTDAATSDNQSALLLELQGKADLTETQPVSVESSALPSGAATSAKQDTLLAELELKADKTETQPAAIYDSTGTNAADVVNYEGEKALRTVIGYQKTYIVHLEADNQSGTVGYMLIDLSDTVNWPHEDTAHIILKQIVVQSNQTTSPAFLGYIRFGFLSAVDGTNGDFNRIGSLTGDRGTPLGGGNFDFSVVGMGLELDEWFGPTTANDTTWQTDVNLLGPDGSVAYPSGNGDFVCKLVSTAGAISFGITVVYTTSSG